MLQREAKGLIQKQCSRMRILLTTEYKMVWLNLAYNMVNHVTVMDKKLIIHLRRLVS